MLEKVAIITGASSGIGEATARRLARAGARLTLTARRADQLDRVARLIQSEDHVPADQLLTLPGDICQPDHIQAIVKATFQRWGRIDVLVNNAGVVYDHFLVNMPDADLRQEVATNLTAPIALAQAVLPQMLRQRAGHILNISSIAGLIALPGISVYSATKFGLQGFSEALRREVKPYRIRVTSVCLGYVATPLTPALKQLAETGANPAHIPFVMQPGQAAAIILSAIRHPRRQVIWPYAYSILAAGANLSPAIADHIIPLFIPR